MKVDKQIQANTVQQEGKRRLLFSLFDMLHSTIFVLLLFACCFYHKNTLNYTHTHNDELTSILLVRGGEWKGLSGCSNYARFLL